MERPVNQLIDAAIIPNPKSWFHEECGDRLANSVEEDPRFVLKQTVKSVKRSRLCKANFHPRWFTLIRSGNASKSRIMLVPLVVRKTLRTGKSVRGPYTSSGDALIASTTFDRTEPELKKVKYLNWKNVIVVMSVHRMIQSFSPAIRKMRTENGGISAPPFWLLKVLEPLIISTVWCWSNLRWLKVAGFWRHWKM